LPVMSVREVLGRLTERALVSRSSATPVTYAALIGDGALESRVERAVHEFRTNPVQVMAFMTKNSMERLRTGALRAFADAFRWKGPKSDG
jgi:hypothetical protein